MRRISGITSSGLFTLGNYLGAMRHWPEGQERGEHFFFIANLHAITVRQDPQELAERTLAGVAWLLACGVDPAKSVIFVQSQVRAHSELAWILNNYATFGELSRMTQFKDKSQKVGPEGQLAGLFDYPVLMAADILLYDADQVPVGEDQVQHIELTRDIATRFNNLHGDTFVVPKAVLPKETARVMNLQNPEVKMSKSDTDASVVILLSDSMRVMEQKIMRAVTDSGSEVRAAENKPAITNLMNIYAGLSGDSLAQIEKRYAGRGYGDFKKDLADLVVNDLAPLASRFQDLFHDRDYLWSVAEQGAQRAAEVADPKLAAVKTKVGLL